MLGVELPLVFRALVDRLPHLLGAGGPDRTIGLVKEEAGGIEWQAYEPHLGDLKAALGDVLPTYPDVPEAFVPRRT